jgi:cyclic pyranopterin phosphate synthase
VRRDLERLVGAIAATPGIEDVAMTTNGHTFARSAEALAAAGLRRVNISVDTLDPERFARITRGGDLTRVLAAVDAALAHGLTPVKINCVVVAGENEDDLDRMVDHFSQWPDRVQVRFIEKMPFRDEPRRCVPSRVLRERLAARFTLEAAPRRVGTGPAATFRLRETGLIVGFISPITEHFCEACNRLRLQADGDLRTCLSRDDSPNLREVLRAGIEDEALEQLLRELVWGKIAGHEAHLERWRGFEGVMTHIGG